MKHIRGKFRRLSFSAIALLMAVVGAVPLLLSQQASAAQLASRSIQMSSSAPSSTLNIYKVNFTVANAATNLGGLVIEFCSNTPIIGDTTCTAPSGMDIVKASLGVYNQTNATGWTVNTTSSTASRVVLTRTAGAPTAAAISFELGNGTNGITNPSTVSTSGNQGTFYGRIYTYATNAGATGYTLANPNAGAAYTDAGGVAISAASQLNITAKVQEALSFCVYTGANCSAGGTAVNLGDSNGVLSSTTTAYTATAKFDLSSNAQTGVIVRMKGDTIKSGANTIAAVGASCTVDGTTSSTAYFGMRISTVGASQSATAPYNCSSGSHGFDATTACSAGDENVTCKYGDRIASTAGPQNSSTSTMEFVAKAATTTNAGIYTATLGYVATGTY